MAPGPVAKLEPGRPCPICRKPSVQAFHPFCSARCQDIDLNRWLSGAYVIPAGEEPEADDEADGVPEAGADDQDEV